METRRSNPESSLRSQLSAIKSDRCAGGPSPKAAQDDRCWKHRHNNDSLETHLLRDLFCHFVAFVTFVFALVFTSQRAAVDWRSSRYGFALADAHSPEHARLL
jgi:hypothetical protein